jgi:hypothetical protein
MPNLCGAETAQQLRKHGYTGIIMGMTGDPVGCFDREAFEASGLDMCVNKDSQGVQRIVRELNQLLDRVVDQSTRRRQAARGPAATVLPQ